MYFKWVFRQVTFGIDCLLVEDPVQKLDQPLNCLQRNVNKFWIVGGRNLFYARIPKNKTCKFVVKFAVYLIKTKFVLIKA